MTRDPDDDGFLSRWSRRKLAPAPEPAVAPEPEGLLEPAPELAPEPEPERTDAEILSDLGLRDPDEMQQGDDFAAFMQRAVPEHLRRRALRKLWTSNPVLACLDGLNDYDTDFTGDSVAPGMLKTSYEVGRGYLRDLVDAETEATPEIEAETEHTVAETELDAPVPESPVSVEEMPKKQAEPPESEGVATRRRMKFRYTAV